MKRYLTATILTALLTGIVFADGQQTGEQLFSAGKYEEALRAFEHELQTSPSSIRALTNLGCTLHRLGREDEALAMLKRAVSVEAESPAKARAYYNLGNLYYSAQRRLEAIEAYKSALRLNPRDSLAKYNLEIALKEQPPQPPPPPKSDSPQNSEGDGTPPPSPQMSQSEAEQIMEAARQNERGPAFKGNRSNYFNTMVKRDW